MFKNYVERAEGVAPVEEVVGENWPGGEDDLVFQYKKIRWKSRLLNINTFFRPLHHISLLWTEETLFINQITILHVRNLED